MRRIAGTALLAAACVAVPGFAGGPPLAEDAPATVNARPPLMDEVLTMRVDGTISVDETGKVIGYELTTQLGPDLRKLIAQSAATWVFFPPNVDGKPTAMKTGMRITLLGRKLGEGYKVTIDNVRFPDAKDERTAGAYKATVDGMTLSIVSRTPTPVFPKYNVNGMVTVLLDIAPDGKVIDAVATQCSLYHAGGTDRQLARACRELGGNTVSAVRKWTFRVDTHGKPLERSVSATLPVQYIKPGLGEQLAREASQPGHWRHESRTRYRLPEWARGERFAQRMGTSDAVGDELMSSDSPLKLRAGQVGAQSQPIEAKS